MNKRELMLALAAGQETPPYTPAAFFMHFDPKDHRGQAAIDKHLEFFRYTGMDLVKIQFEQSLPEPVQIQRAEDWRHVPRLDEEFFEPSIRVAAGLVQAAQKEALVIMTIYSPWMWARRIASDAVLEEHFKENPEAARKGLETLTENVLTLVRGCKRAGIDGFYASTQGGEAGRFQDKDFFRKTIKPSDLAVWEELKSCTFNILHVCDYEAGYDDLTPFLDYPGQVVNSSLKVGAQSMTSRQAAQLFGRPFMGGMERKGVLATGSPEEIRQAVEAVLDDAPERFVLAADCTVPGETPWENLKTAVDQAHRF